MFKLNREWAAVGCGEPEVSQTMTSLTIQVDDTNLTEHESVWSKELQKNIIVSAYPLAVWFAQSWWRLLYEPLPLQKMPSTDWRMAHEIGAANHGFVWPKIAFISDSEYIQVVAEPSDMACKQSARYLNGLQSPVFVQRSDFEKTLTSFIKSVIERLDNTCENSDLKMLWESVRDEQMDLDSKHYRMIEAQMGYDPDECSSDIVDHVLSLMQQIGLTTLSELAPFYGKQARNNYSIKDIAELTNVKGIIGCPQLPKLDLSTQPHQVMPWKKAVETAKAIRKVLGFDVSGKVENKALFDLLGIVEADFERWQIIQPCKISLAMPLEGRQMKFFPRKEHPLAQRFELARFLGDYIYTDQMEDRHWLANTDLSTARQKYQRAFAAEFLSPIEGLKNHLQDDFSDSALEDAAEHFQVSEKTVTSLLQNNHILKCQAPVYNAWRDQRAETKSVA